MNKIFSPASKPEEWKSLLADPKHWKTGNPLLVKTYALDWLESINLFKMI